MFAQRLLCLSPSPLHAAATTGAASGGSGAAAALSPADLAVEVSAALFQGRQTAQLAQLQRLLPAGAASQDMRLLFFKVSRVGRV
jgi:hypothetical protein